MAACEPVGAHSPLTTFVHCCSLLRPVLLLHLPAGHGVGALAPSPLQKEAIGQTWSG